MSDGRWIVRARCPHGTEVALFFDALGYVRDPGPDACERFKLHEDFTKFDETTTATPSRYRVWRETRRFRKVLRKQHLLS